ncbi:MAG TPA: carboxypeptidase-like regulatory domain-containing protein [Sphingobacteriaceae bacterium]
MKLLSIPLLLFICFFQSVSGQVFSVNGQVNEPDGKPVYGAQVFLDGTSKSVVSDHAGKFKLGGLKPGSYELVVSLLGFKPYSKQILIENDDIETSITLQFNSVALKEVVVQPDLDREQNYQVFLKQFLGESLNARQCRILNPDVLNLAFDKNERLMEADSGGEFLIIENKALGYRLKYLLLEFQLHFQTGMLSYMGKTVFEELKGSASRSRRWNKNRENAYLGSAQHFLSSVYNRSVYQEGYQVRKLIRRPNPDRPSDSVINARIRRFSTSANGTLILGRNDSLDYWISKKKLPKVNQFLLNEFVNTDSLLNQVSGNVKELKFEDNLYVIYTREREPAEYHVWNGTIPRPLDQPNYQTSVLSRNTGSVELDRQGNLMDPLAIFFEGYWAFEKIGDMLPSDYSITL